MATECPECGGGHVGRTVGFGLHDLVSCENGHTWVVSSGVHLE